MSESQLPDELKALRSYFYDLVFIDDFPNKLEVYLKDEVALNIIFPNGNLSTKPVYEVNAPNYSAKFKRKLVSKLENAFKEDLFSLFTCVQIAYDYLNSDEEVNEEGENFEDHNPPSTSHEINENQYDKPTKNYIEVTYREDEDFSWKKKKNKKDYRSEVKVPEIFSGEPLYDRKSTFQAHVARIYSKEEAIAVLDKLKENNKIARATHNIYAYSTNIEKNGRKIKVHDCEDDGETGAGPKLAHLIEMMKVDNLIVVVTRWYGGIHLGPDRFRHICNVAREVIENNVAKK